MDLSNAVRTSGQSVSFHINTFNVHSNIKQIQNLRNYYADRTKIVTLVITTLDQEIRLADTL